MNTLNWMQQLEPHEQREVELANVYASVFAHGTDGHSRLMLIAKLSQLVTELEREVSELSKPQDSAAM